MRQKATLRKAAFSQNIALTAMQHDTVDLVATHRLRTLDLSGCFRTFQMPGPLLDRIVSNKSLTSLDLSYNWCRDDFPRLVSVVKDNKTLRHLALANCRIENAGAQQLLAALMVNSSLQGT